MLQQPKKFIFVYWYLFPTLFIYY